LNFALCIAAISGLLDGEYRSQKTGTKPVQVQSSQHGEQVRAGRGAKVASINEQIMDATCRKPAAQMLRAPLERALLAE